VNEALHHPSLETSPIEMTGEAPTDAPRLFLLTQCSVPVLIEDGYSAHIGNIRERDRNVRVLTEEGVGLPSNYTLWSDAHSELRVVFMAGTRGKLVVRAGSLEVAHDLAHAVWGALFLIRLHTQEPAPLLLEITEEPVSSWDFERVVSALKVPRSLAPHFSSDLETGSGLSDLDLKLLPYGVHAISSNPRLAAALRQLNLSRVLVPDFLEVDDFQSMSGDDLQADYLSHRAHYELAFVAAFKGVEAILGGSQLKKNSIASKFDRYRPGGRLSSSTYQKRIEIAGATAGEQDVVSVVSRFLDIRNAAAAHSNATPPETLRVTLDVVLELQLFLLDLCRGVAGRFRETSLPNEAYVGMATAREPPRDN
jgi:hypothetical protein